MPYDFTLRALRTATSLRYFDLRPTQDLKYEEIVEAVLKTGERELALVAPMAWGKTVVLQYTAQMLVDTGRMRHVFLVAPQRTITTRMKRDRRIGCKRYGRREVVYRPRAIGSEELAEVLFAPDDFEPGVYVVTRQTLCNQTMLLNLATAAEGSLEKCLFLLDEGHHHHSENLAGKCIARFRELGATTILSTGTPFPTQSTLITPSVRVVRVTPSMAATETDEQGRPLMPRHWAVDRVFVDFETDDVQLIEDDGKEMRAEVSSDAFRDACVKSLVSEWVRRGCPKAIMRIPLRTWAPHLKSALESAKTAVKALHKQGRPAPRVVDFTGEGTERVREAMELLEREADSKHVKRYEDSQIDVIIACARFNEGSDWPLCSHVFNVRIPRSEVLNLQLAGRAGRPKVGFEGYPAEHVDTQTMVYFTPTLAGEAVENLDERHFHFAMVCAARWERYESVEDYVNEAPEFDRFRVAKDPTTAAKARKKALIGEEHARGYNTDPFRQDEIVAMAATIITRAGGELPLADVVERLKAKGVDEADAVEVVVRLSRDPEVSGAVAGKRRQSREKTVKMGGRESGVIRAERLEDFREVVRDFGHVPQRVPEGFRMLAAKFSVVDAETLTERLCAAARDVRTPVESARLIVEFSEREGRWPSSSAARDPEEMRLGRALNHLRKCWPALCEAHRIPVHVRAKPRTPEDWAADVAAFKSAHERWPSSYSSNPEERRLGLALSGVLRRKYPEICKSHGIPERQHSKASPDERAASIVRFFTETGRWPRQSASDPEEKRLGHILSMLRQRHRGLCSMHGIPEVGDRSEAARSKMGRQQFNTLAELVPRLCRNWRTGQRTTDIDGDTGEALNRALRDARAKPSSSRGLGSAPDLCQVNSLARANDEIEADCWTLWLEGADTPDPRPWAAILAAGDHKRVVKAERRCYLDWNAGSAPVKRKWSPAKVKKTA